MNTNRTTKTGYKAMGLSYYETPYLNNRRDGMGFWWGCDMKMPIRFENVRQYKNDERHGIMISFIYAEE